MRAHIIKSKARTAFGRPLYGLTAIVYAEPEEREIINAARLGRIAIFADPLKQEFSALAQSNHDKAKSHGLLVFKARDASSVAAHELRALCAALRAARAFSLTLSDLLKGVTIHHKSLQAITQIQTAIIQSVDAIDTAMRNAHAFADNTEDIFAPGDADTNETAPAAWAQLWRR